MTDLRGRGPVGRGDLIAAIGLAETAEDAAQIASMLGFEVDDAFRPRLDADSSSSVGSQDTAGSSPSVPPQTRPRVRMWRVDRVEFMPLAEDDPPARVPFDSQGLTLTPDQVGRPHEPQPRPVWPAAFGFGPAWRRAIEQVARRREPRGEVDVEAIVESFGLGESLRCIPREPIARRVPRLLVVPDFADRLYPVWEDVHEACAWIVGELGEVELRVWAGLDVLADLEPGDVLLVIGDLGVHAEPALVQAWAELGKSLRERGVANHALMVCPADRWTASLVQTWTCIDAAEPGRGFAGTRSLADIEARRERLLARLAWTVRIEPGLLRAARLVLGGFDLGTELDVWSHPGVRPHAEGLTVDEGLRAAKLAESAAPRDELVLVREVVRAWHAELPREIFTEELQALDSIAPRSGLITQDDEARVLEFYRCLIGYFERGSSSLGATVRVAAWTRRSTGARIAATGWDHPVWGAALREAFERCREGIDRLPDGLTLDKLTGELGPLRSWAVWQVQDRLVIRPESAPAPERGSWVITMLARAGRITVDGEIVELHDLEGDEVPLPNGDAVELASDCVRYWLCRETRPDWAHAFGRDAIGLWATLRVGSRGGEVEQRMRWIVPGRFMMGSPDSEVGRWNDEGPQHRVTITQGFWLADTPCTQAMWEAMTGTNPSRFKGGRRPVERVSADEVDAAVQRIPGMRLPTEAQWEYACRAGTTTATHVGDLKEKMRDTRLDAIAWYHGNAGGETHEVGLKSSNRWGLYDMLGNVYEWCADHHRTYSEEALADPRQRHGRNRVSRGGSWHDLARFVRAAYRSWDEPGNRYGYLGFRLAGGQEIVPSPGERSDQPAGSRGAREASKGRGGAPTGADRRAPKDDQ